MNTRPAGAIGSVARISAYNTQSGIFFHPEVQKAQQRQEEGDEREEKNIR